MKTRLFFLTLLILGYWIYLHDFQTKAMTGINNLKFSYEQAINTETVNLSPVNHQK